MSLAVANVFICWGKWGPYHYARFNAAAESLGAEGFNAIGIELNAASGTYPWEAQADPRVLRLELPAPESRFRPFRITRGLVTLLRLHRPRVVYVPSYRPNAVLLAALAKMFGAAVVMMNETHAATTRGGVLRTRFKRWIIPRFDAAVIGGTAQRDFATSMGLSANRVFDGYDVVDNQHFITRAAASRLSPDQARLRLGLPPSYILSLGRFVPKKNLTLLVEAYGHLVAEDHQDLPELVFVGGGPEEASLRASCVTFGIEVLELAPAGRSAKPGVRFLPYASYQESPEIFAHADVFVLPSRLEEWGLVVNEAMCCGTPVVVSDAVGCVPDLCIDRETAFVFRSGSARDLAQAISSALSTEGREVANRALEHIAAWDVTRFGTGVAEAARKCTDASR